MTSTIIDTAEIELEAFYADVSANDLQPLWTQTRKLMPDTPLPATQPWQWSWSTLRALAERAGKLITIERGGERRVLALANPGLHGLPYATATMWGAIQFLGPHESAPAHRHSPSAIRFVIEGRGVWTTVNGDALDMEPGDLILTPGWNWHDHNNGSDEPMLWFDGLDLPFVIGLEAVFFENYPDLLQPVVEPHNITEREYGQPGLVPIGHAPIRAHSPLLRYPWATTDRVLRDLIKKSSTGHAAVEFSNPVAGGPAIRTFSNEMHRFASGARVGPVRRTGSAIVIVHSGSGRSIIAGQEFTWSKGDMLVLPSWAAVEHEATEPTDLFIMSDRPILEAVGLYREDADLATQDVQSTFVPR